MWTFEQPAFLLLALLLPLLAWIRHGRKVKGGTVRFALASWKGDHFVPPLTGISLLARFLEFCFWLGILVLILALAGPVETRRERIFLNRGIDIMVVMDVSPSMAAQDMAGRSRLDLARDTIRSFLHRRENDPVGLVAFGSEARLQVPPTLDYRGVEKGLDSLQAMGMGEGTALGLGLAMAAVHMKNSSAREKVVILLTDGDSNAGEITPDMAAGILADLGIRIYALGIGSDDEVPLEYKDPSTGKIFRGVYRGRFDEDRLKSLALATGGQYFSVRSPVVLESSLGAIDALEKSENRVRIRIAKTSLSQGFLLVALILLSLDLVLRRLVVKELA